MTELLSKAIEAMENLTPIEQDQIARAMLDFAQTAGLDEIDPEHLDDVMQGLAELERGEIATEEEVEAAFRSFRR